MIHLAEYIRRLEVELRATRTVSPSSYQEFADLSHEHQSALSGTLAFLSGADAVARPGPVTRSVPEDLRVAAARLMLLRLGADSQDPRWSSWVLDRMLETVLSTPGGETSDLLRALIDVLGEQDDPPSRVAANFVKDVAILCFVTNRRSFDTRGLSWMKPPAGRHVTAGQAYLALYVLSSAAMPEMEHQIRKALAGTSFEEEVERQLQQDEPDLIADTLASQGGS